MICWWQLQHQVLMQLNSLQFPTMLFCAPPSRLLNQDISHRISSSSEEMTPVIPARILTANHT